MSKSYQVIIVFFFSVALFACSSCARETLMPIAEAGPPITQQEAKDFWKDLDDHTIHSHQGRGDQLLKKIYGVDPTGIANRNGVWNDLNPFQLAAGAAIKHQIKEAHGKPVDPQEKTDVQNNFATLKTNGVLQRLSDLQIEIIKKHFSTGAGAIDFDKFQEAAEMFANGELRPHDMDQMYQWMVWKQFAEAAINANINKGDWEKILKSLQKGLEIYRETHPGADSSTFFGELWRESKNFDQTKQLNLARKKKLRADVDPLTTPNLLARQKNLLKNMTTALADPCPGTTALTSTASLLPVSPATAPMLYPSGVIYSMAGRGNASGDVLGIKVTNNTMCHAAVSILGGTVARPSDTRYQEMIIGESYLIELAPGQAKTVVLWGYCLEAEKLPPAKPEDNRTLTYKLLDTQALPESQRQQYAFLATIIQEGNKLSTEGKYDTTPLSPPEAKKTVIQWTIWHVRKLDVYNQAKLEEDVTKQFKEAGADLADPKVQEEIRHGSSLIWAAVDLTLKEARTRSMTDISRKDGPRDTPPVPTGKNVPIPHSRGTVSVPEEMAKTVKEVVTVLQKATYKVGKQNLTWDKDREEMTIDVPAAGNKLAQQYVIDHQGFILSHRVDGKLVSRTNVGRDEKGVPFNVTRKEYKTEEKVEQGKKWTVTTTESVRKYVEVHPQTGDPQGLVTEKRIDKERKSEAGEMSPEKEEKKEEERYESHWWEKTRDEWKKVDLKKR